MHRSDCIHQALYNYRPIYIIKDGAPAVGTIYTREGMGYAKDLDGTIVTVDEDVPMYYYDGGIKYYLNLVGAL